jgi:Transglutaminase-like superfamily
MRIFLLFSCGFFISGALRSQDVNYAQTDRIISSIPSSQTNSTNDIAAFIRQHFSTDEQKVRAAYTWVANNIRYSTDSIHRVILDEDADQRVTVAMRRKQGVCENFAAIFNDICLKSGIRSYAIEGYTNDNGKLDRMGHVWCAAWINNQWWMYDPTWDAGFSNGMPGRSETRYFQVSPQDFIQTHIPYDPLFQFLYYPVSYSDFLSNRTTEHVKEGYFNYPDSLAAYEKMDKLSQYLSSFSRIGHYGMPANASGVKLKQIKLEIELIYQDRDMALYNAAVDGYNSAIAVFNQFINYRNNQFKPLKKDQEVQEMFNSMLKEIAASNLKLKQVNLSKATLTLDTGDIQKKLDDLAAHIKEQQSFYKSFQQNASTAK